MKCNFRFEFAVAVLLAVTSFNEYAQGAEPYILIQDAYYRSLDQGVPTNPIACPSPPIVATLKSQCDMKSGCAFNVWPGTPPLTCSDPGGHAKRLRVSYTCNWTSLKTGSNTGVKSVPGGDELLPVKMDASALDNQSLNIDCTNVRPVPITTPRIKVQSTTYGSGPNSCKFDRFANSLCEDATKCSFRVGAELCPGDPVVGTLKHAEVSYQCKYVWYDWQGFTPPVGFPKALAPEMRKNSAKDGDTVTISCE